MRNCIIVLFSMLLMISCEGEQKATKSEKSATEKKVTNAETTTQPLSTENEQFFATTIAYFKNCKTKAVNRNDCRNSSTKMISEFYKIDDFKNTNGEYIVFDSIQPIIKRTASWERVGNAGDQNVLEKAQNAANEGNATIAIDISELYGQVAMIIPGKLTTSGSWKREVPNAAALIHYNADKSFVNQPLSYAFKTPKNIVLYSRMTKE